MANIAGYPSAVISGSPGKSGRINMANIAGYPSAVISGTPGKSGRIQGFEITSPLELTNIIGWWDAGQGITLNGSDVSDWADQSVNANNLAQTTGSKQPLFVDPGGVPPLVRFDKATSESMLTSGFAGGPLLQPNTVMIVCKKNSGSDGSTLTDGIAPGTTRNAILDLSGDFGIFAGDILSSLKPIDQVKRIIVAIFDMTVSAMYFDGGAAEIVGNASGANWNGLTLCSRFSDTGFADYDVWEITAYNKRLSVNELNQLGRFLANKHSLTWTTIP